MKLTNEQAIEKRNDINEKFKHMFIPFNKDGPNYSINLFGLQVGNGWLHPIEIFFNKLEWIRTHNQHLNENNEMTQIFIHDIKEKFGGIRIYYSAICCERITNMIEEAIAYCEALTDCTCELCGSRQNADGSYVKNESEHGWCSVTCNDCKHKEFI